MTAVSRNEADPLATMAAQMNGDTVRAQRVEIRRLRAALGKIAYGKVKGAALEVVAKFQRTALEALAK